MFLNSLIISFFLIAIQFVFSFSIDFRGTSLSDFSVLTNYISESQVSYSIEPLISIPRYFYQRFFSEVDPNLFLLIYEFNVLVLVIATLIFTVTKCFGTISYQLLFFLVAFLGIFQGENILLFRSFNAAILMQCALAFFFSERVRNKNEKAILLATSALMCHFSSLLIIINASIIGLFSIRSIKNYLLLFKGFVKYNLKILLSILFLLFSAFYISQFKIVVSEFFLNSVESFFPLIASKISFYTERYSKIHADNPYPFLPVIKYTIFLMIPLYFSNILFQKNNLNETKEFTYFYYFWMFSLVNLLMANFAFLFSTVATLRVLQLGKASIYFLYVIYFRIIKNKGINTTNFNILITLVSFISILPVFFRSDIECLLMSCIK